MRARSSRNGFWATFLAGRKTADKVVAKNDDKVKGKIEGPFLGAGKLPNPYFQGVQKIFSGQKKQKKHNAQKLSMCWRGSSKNKGNTAIL